VERAVTTITWASNLVWIFQRDARPRSTQAADQVLTQFQHRATMPPTRLGASEPLSLAHCISFTAADGLTSQPAAAQWIELPFSTAWAMRRRRSYENGVVMVGLNAHAPLTRESDAPISFKFKYFKYQILPLPKDRCQEGQVDFFRTL